MRNHAYALLTGLFVIVLGAAAAGASFWLSGQHVATRPYRIVTHKPISGLTPGSKVLYMGVPGGKITDIHLARNRARTVVIDLAINKSVHVTDSTYAKLHMQGLAGARQVDLLDSGESTQPLATSGRHPGVIPLKPSLLQSVSHSGKHLMANLDQASARLNQFLNEKNVNQLEQLLAHANAAAAELTRLEKHLDRTAVTLPRLSRYMQKTLTNMDRLTRHATRLANTGQKLVHAVHSQSLPELNKTLRNLRKTSDSIRTLSRNLNRDPQRLLYGNRQPPPGPGERGYHAPQR